MIKRIFAAVLAAGTLVGTAANKNSEPVPNNKSIAAPFEKVSEVTKDRAMKMMGHARDRSCKKSNGAWAYFSKNTIDSLSALPHVVGFRLVAACYLDDESDDKKRNRQTLLLQLHRQQRSAGDVYEEFSYYTSNLVCPPPDNTSCEAVAELQL